jgi:hypothetical protein
MGPALREIDFSIFKDFVFTERVRMQFRTEIFNLFNTPEYGFPDSGYGDTQFGQVTGTLAVYRTAHSVRTETVVLTTSTVRERPGGNFTRAAHGFPPEPPSCVPALLHYYGPFDPC